MSLPQAACWLVRKDTKGSPWQAVQIDGCGVPVVMETKREGFLEEVGVGRDSGPGDREGGMQAGREEGKAASIIPGPEQREWRGLLQPGKDSWDM